MGSISYFYFGGATQVLVTANLNEASGVTGFVLPRLGKLRITINEVVTVLVAMSAYSTIPIRRVSEGGAAMASSRKLPKLQGSLFKYGSKSIQVL
ncbi:hypothetical protein M758_UG172700 [Ceratodon purpureus]|nr:hypothetical protein M758_UG172700 [Ceratodon purpureus]